MIRFTCDPVLARVAVRILDPKVHELAFATAKVEATRHTRLLALIKHSAAVCAALSAVKDELDQFIYGWAKLEWRTADPGILQENMRALRLWKDSGDPIYLSVLGVDLTKHAGFGASRGVNKRDAGIFMVASGKPTVCELEGSTIL